MSDDPIDFSELLESSIRWPTVGDQLFEPLSGWAGNAMLEHNQHGRFVFMMRGYKEAADILVQRATEDRVVRDTLVYPIIFSYRHFLELSLKYIIKTYGPAAGVEPTWKNDHKLGPLFSKVAEIFAAYGLEPDDAHVIVAACIAEFDAVDERSSNFRFAFDTNGEAIPLAFERVDLLRLRDVMSGLEAYFDGADGYLSHCEDAASEALWNEMYGI